jgi:hypothetical protein
MIDEKYANGFETLIKAFKIFSKYNDSYAPIGCEHDVMYVYVDPAKVSAEDLEELDHCGFFPNDEYSESFESYRFGSG